ncbi:hypothetical protein MLD38_034116 [Melastoma candidum]|uniref:Uncharacterized protein n=1 Tax=Melastoma candidum TaxID=119954 RepID=A0ACB9M9I1_9MYRT|nr:hypothetical protein MLD38_034116 [Melastoma candidum]
MRKQGCCFWTPFLSSSSPLPSSSSLWERIQATDRLPEGPWWIRGWKRFCEWSEVVAGLRWKNFIRRLSKNRMMRKGR